MLASVKTDATASNEQERRSNLSGDLWAEMVKHRSKEKFWGRIHKALVSGSIIGNVIGIVTALAKALENFQVVQGLLIALPTIVFAVDQGFMVTAFALWHQQAGDAFSDLYDRLYYERLTLEEGFQQKSALDAQLRAIQPHRRPIAVTPERPNAPPPPPDPANKPGV
jgi:hypothetical protein